VGGTGGGRWTLDQWVELRDRPVGYRAAVEAGEVPEVDVFQDECFPRKEVPPEPITVAKFSQERSIVLTRSRKQSGKVGDLRGKDVLLRIDAGLVEHSLSHLTELQLLLKLLCGV
jgi:hypothetical protein